MRAMSRFPYTICKIKEGLHVLFFAFEHLFMLMPLVILKVNAYNRTAAMASYFELLPEERGSP